MRFQYIVKQCLNILKSFLAIFMREGRSCLLDAKLRKQLYQNFNIVVFKTLTEESPSGYIKYPGD